MDDATLPAELVSAHALVQFHARHKLLLMAHAPAEARALGRLVARAGDDDLSVVWRDYCAGFERVLSGPSSRGGHVNALLHAFGYFRGVADDGARQQMLRAIEQYAAGACSFAAPARLLRAAAERHGVTWLVEQTYLQPPFVAHER